MNRLLLLAPLLAVASVPARAAPPTAAAPRAPSAAPAPPARRATAVAPAPSLAAGPRLAAAPSPAAEPPAPSAETLSLPEALERLEARNHSLAAARARVDEARAQVRLARAQLLPTVAASGQYARNSDEAALSLGRIFDGIEAGLEGVTGRPVALDRRGLPGDVVIQPLDAWTAAGTVQVPLLAPAGWADAAAARRAADAEAARLEAVRADLRTALVQAAYGEAAAREVVRAAERALDAAVEHRDAARRSVEAGIAPPLTLLAAETEVTRRSSELVRARSALEGARLAVGALLGEARPVAVVTPEPEAPAEAAPPVTTALASRPEIAAAGHGVEAAKKAVLSARLRHLPRLSASGTAFTSTAPYPTGEDAGWRATVDLTWILYDGGFRYGKADEAEARLAAARAAHDEARERVSREVQDAVREARVAAERLALAKQTRATAAEAAAVAERAFAAGQAGSLDVLDAQDRLYAAEVAQAEARARLGAAVAALARAAGRAP
jgi:outer membrane protein TolC